MNVTDEAKLITIRKQLIESQFKLNSAIKIIDYVFDRVGDNGLYPGQIQAAPLDEEIQSPIGEECLD
jgi:hypothetical protein